MWIATWDGLAGFDDNEWKLYDSEYSLDWIVSTSDGRLWSQDRKLGLMEFDGQKWIRALDLKNSLLESGTAKLVQVDSKGKILIGTADVGVFKYDQVLNSIIDLKLGKINVHLIKEISDESIWIGTDNGLHQHNGVKWLQHQYQSRLKTFITAITETPKDRIWVSGQSGLFHFDGRTSAQEQDYDNELCCRTL